MSYTRTGMGAVALDASIQAARPRLGDMLNALLALGETSTLKILPSNNETVAGEVCGSQRCENVTSPSLWAGSNVIVWPAADYADLNRAWDVANAYVGAKGAFALDLTNISKAVTALRQLISAVDLKMRFSGLEIKTSSTNYLPWILAGVGVIGALVVTTRPIRGKARKRTARRRR